MKEEQGRHNVFEQLIEHFDKELVSIDRYATLPAERGQKRDTEPVAPWNELRKY